MLFTTFVQPQIQSSGCGDTLHLVFELLIRYTEGATIDINGWVMFLV
jgi:hypothetical protein